MLSQPAPGSIELLVLSSVLAGSRTVTAISQRLGQPDTAVRATVDRLAQTGLVTSSGETVALTEHGRMASSHLRSALPRMQTRPGQPVFGLADAARFIGTAWSAVPADRLVPGRNARDRLLASDADRDIAVQRLSDAFADGRLSAPELEERTGRALAARTHGELNGVLLDLGGMPAQPRRHTVRRAVFWIAAVLATPWVLFGTLFTLFGADTEAHVAGIFVLLLALPGLVLLGRWAFRRT